MRRSRWEAALHDLSVEALACGIGLGAEFLLEGFPKLFVLPEGPMTLAAPEVQAHQPHASLFVSRLDGHRFLKRLDGRSGLQLMLLVERSQLQEQREVELPKL